MEYLSLEASRMASSLLLVACTSLCESSETAILQCSSLSDADEVSGAGDGDGRGVVRRDRPEMRDLKRPFGVGDDVEERELLWWWYFSTGNTTTEAFSRVDGRQSLQDTPEKFAGVRRVFPVGFFSWRGVGWWWWKVVLSVVVVLVIVLGVVTDPKRCRSSVSSLSFPSCICKSKIQQQKSLHNTQTNNII